jgi:hypothetical protein
LEELRYYFILAKDLGYAETSEHSVALEDVSKLLTGYMAGIELNS